MKDIPSASSSKSCLDNIWIKPKQPNDNFVRIAAIALVVFAILCVGLGVFGTMGVLQPSVGISQIMSSLVTKLGVPAFGVMLGVGYASGILFSLFCVILLRKAKKTELPVNPEPHKNIQNPDREQPDGTTYIKIADSKWKLVFSDQETAMFGILTRKDETVNKWITEKQVPLGHCWHKNTDDGGILFIVNDGRYYVLKGNEESKILIKENLKYECTDQNQTTDQTGKYVDPEQLNAWIETRNQMLGDSPTTKEQEYTQPSNRTFDFF